MLTEENFRKRLFTNVFATNRDGKMLKTKSKKLLPS